MYNEGGGFMSNLTPRDASMLALIAENRKSPKQVKKLMQNTSPSALGIAKSIVANSSTGTKAERQVAKAIQEWADTNDPKQLAASTST
jgi:hypothetical protein